MGDKQKQCNNVSRDFCGRRNSFRSYSLGPSKKGSPTGISVSGKSCRGTSFCASCNSRVDSPETSVTRVRRKINPNEYSLYTLIKHEKSPFCEYDSDRCKNPKSYYKLNAQLQRYLDDLKPLIHNRDVSPPPSQRLPYQMLMRRTPLCKENYEQMKLPRNRCLSAQAGPGSTQSPIRLQSPMSQQSSKSPQRPQRRPQSPQSIKKSNEYLKTTITTPSHGCHASKLQSMDWKAYHRLAVIYNFLHDTEKKYPSLCTVHVIGSSNEGRKIKLLKVSDTCASNSAVWIDSGIHAREWIGPAVNTYVAKHIVKYFHSLPNYVTNKDWYFLPVVNPDGYEYSHTENRMWRKNRAKLKGKCVGVDLNRNFSFGWGGNGSSDDPQHNFYRGPSPFSEPESRAVRDIIANSNIDFKVYITLHSYGQVIIMPFACRETLCPNYIQLLQGATVMSKAIYETHGNIYKVGISKDVMYKAAGTSNDWSHGAMRIPYCYLIELRSRKHKFKVPQEEIEETGQEILNSLIALMEHVDSNSNGSKKARTGK